MDYERAMTLYMKCRREVELIEGEMAKATALPKEKMLALAQWMEAKALQDGLKNVPVTGVGTGYWTTALSASVANPAAFWDFIKENQAFDLVETRAKATAVKSFIEGHNTPVPGVNFAQTKIFKIRAANQSDKEGS